MNQKDKQQIYDTNSSKQEENVKNTDEQQTEKSDLDDTTTRSQTQQQERNNNNVPLSFPEQCENLPYEIKYISDKKGRGLVAKYDLPFRFHIHTAPCLFIKQEEYEKHMKHTILEEYLFGNSTNGRLLAFGHGSLFNHDSKKPNVDYRVDMKNQQIHYYVGISSIRKGEELCIYYGPSSRLWFPDENDSISSSESSNEGGQLSSFLAKIEL